MIIQYMENYSYDYALSQGYIPVNSLKKVPMKDMFDMFAGTSTGGIVAAALVSPNGTADNLYYADGLISLFKDQGPLLFKS